MSVRKETSFWGRANKERATYKGIAVGKDAKAEESKVKAGRVTPLAHYRNKYMTFFMPQSALLYLSYSMVISTLHPP